MECWLTGGGLVGRGRVFLGMPDTVRKYTVASHRCWSLRTMFVAVCPALFVNGLSNTALVC